MSAPKKNAIDSFYLPAEKFFPAAFPTALTYDDVSLATLYSDILPRETRLDTVLSPRLKLSLPIISADMDTVTESRMAIAMALQGGLGLIHYNMPTAEQVREVERVKNHIHGLIQDPAKVRPEQTIAEVLKIIEDKHYSFRTFPVVDDKGVLVGLLSGRVVKERYRGHTVAEAMTPRKEVFTINQRELKKDPIAAADRFFNEHLGINKLLVVDNTDKLCGLFTLSDIERLGEEALADRRPSRDGDFHLRCGAALAIARTPSGDLDKKKFADYIGALLDAGVDALAVSTAHGHTRGVGEAVKFVRSLDRNVTLIAGNVTSGAGVEFLADCGANAIKVGQGPGSICTTRVVAGVGVPQLTALYAASRGARKKGVAIIADGGITKSGDIVKALTLANAVMLGGLLGGCREAPGDIMEINGKFYKQYRGMGSMAAMKAGSAARYGHDVKAAQARHSKIAAEGVEALKEIAGSVVEVVTQLAGGLQSGMGYLGAATLEDLRKNARYVRLTSAGFHESTTHDVIEIKTGNKNA